MRLFLAFGLFVLAFALIWFSRSAPEEHQAASGRGASESPQREGAVVELVDGSGRQAQKLRFAPEVVSAPPLEVIEALGSADEPFRIGIQVTDDETGVDLTHMADVRVVQRRGGFKQGEEPTGGAVWFSLDEGQHEIRTRVPHYGSGEDVIVLSGQGRRIVHEVRLRQLRSVVIYATTPDGMPLEEAMRSAGLASKYQLSACVMQIARVGQRLSIKPPRRGMFRGARFDSSLASLKAALDTQEVPKTALGVLEPPNDASGVALVLDRTVVAFELLGGNELHFQVPINSLVQKLATVDVDLRGPKGQPLTGEVSISEFPFLFLGRQIEGTGTFEELSPDQLFLVAEAAGMGIRVLELDLKSGEHRKVRVDFQPERTISGRIVNGEGEGVLADVHLLDSTGVQVGETRTHASGDFHFLRQAPGEHAIVLAADAESATNTTVHPWAAPPRSRHLGRV